MSVYEKNSTQQLSIDSNVGIDLKQLLFYKLLLITAHKYFSLLMLVILTLPHIVVHEVAVVQQTIQDIVFDEI